MEICAYNVHQIKILFAFSYRAKKIFQIIAEVKHYFSSTNFWSSISFLIPFLPHVIRVKIDCLSILFCLYHITYQHFLTISIGIIDKYYVEYFHFYCCFLKIISINFSIYCFLYLLKINFYQHKLVSTHYFPIAR